MFFAGPIGSVVAVVEFSYYFFPTVVKDQIVIFLT